MSLFILLEELQCERRDLLKEMVKLFDRTGEMPHPKDIDRISELDEAIMKIKGGGM